MIICQQLYIINTANIIQIDKFQYMNDYLYQSPKVHKEQVLPQYTPLDPQQIKHLIESYDEKVKTEFQYGSQLFQQKLQQIQNEHQEIQEEDTTKYLQYVKMKQELFSDQLIACRENVRAILQKIIPILSHYLQFEEYHRYSSLTYKHELEEKTNTIASLQQQIQFLKEKIEKDTRYAESIFVQNDNLKHKIQQLQLQHIEEKAAIQKQIAEQQFRQLQSKQVVKELHENNTNLNKLLILSKKQRSEIEENHIQLTQKNKQLTMTISNLEGKLLYNDKKNKELDLEIRERDKIINEMEEQIQSLRDVLRNPFEKLQHQKIEEPTTVREKFRKFSDQSELQRQRRHKETKEVVRLSEDYPGDQYDPTGFQKSFIGRMTQMGVNIDKKERHKKSFVDEWEQSYNERMDNRIDVMNSKQSKSEYNLNIEPSVPNQEEIKTTQQGTQHQQPKEQSQKKKLQLTNNQTLKLTVNNKTEPKKSFKKMPITIDPYYSHFILTAQCIKIRENCQQMLMIDVKPLYKQILEKTIPMHEWEEWIKTRLRKIIKQNSKDIEQNGAKNKKKNSK